MNKSKVITWVLAIGVTAFVVYAVTNGVFESNPVGENVAFDHFIEQPKNISTSPVVCESSLDAVNGIHPIPDTLTADKTLTVQGWMAIDTKNGTVPDSVFVTLTAANGKAQYVKARSTPRSDVKEYFKQPNMSDPGFEANIDTSSLDGNYVLGLARLYQGQVEQCQYNIPLVISHK
ncbi:MAG: hypothetical protein ACHP6H_07645 [Legionellales bacterium]